MKPLFCVPVILFFSCGLFFSAACRQPQAKSDGQNAAAFMEGFEQGSKRAYAAAQTELRTGQWNLDGALIGNSGNDLRIGNASLRLAAGGKAEMAFDLQQLPDTVSLRHGAYGNDKDVRISVWYSNDGGRRWKPLAKSTTSGDGLSGMEIALQKGYAAPIRFRVQNDGSGRVNIDNFGSGAIDFKTRPVGPAAGHSNIATTYDAGDVNLLLGNPSNARADAAAATNYLLVHPQYTLSYNSTRGSANWVSWHLSQAEQGSAPRCNCFGADPALPEAFYHVQTSNYIGSGFDRGHICPSDDRSGSAEANAATFLMPNIAPQAPDLNQKSWKALEEYARRLTEDGKELYIISGCYGEGGTGSKGAAKQIAGGKITVPSHFWKILVVLPDGENDLKRITGETEVIAVDMPNTQSAGNYDWQSFRCTISSLEKATGYRFFSALRPEVAQALRNR